MGIRYRRPTVRAQCGWRAASTGKLLRTASETGRPICCRVGQYVVLKATDGLAAVGSALEPEEVSPRNPGQARLLVRGNPGVEGTASVISTTAIGGVVITAVGLVLKLFRLEVLRA